MVDDVQALYRALMPLAEKYDFLISLPKTFGLEIDVFDPHTGLLFSAARANRRDLSIDGVMLTPEQVLHTVLSTRGHR